MSWRDSAIKYIAQGLIDYKELQLERNIPVDPVYCQRWLNKECYPFGIRENTPYKIWLEETKRTIYFWQVHQDPTLYTSWRFSLARAAKSGRKQAIAIEAAGQIRLF